ncbi:MAG: hypothetical protein PHQ11_12535 [Paludibacter sp.]|nr:hypothetical protein [Paludibacter sp.]MDD4199526.1 hypothetical protein [Paludibacter sp.]MDD4427192.1 hypothetical protein [Paludibacter sp.]
MHNHNSHIIRFLRIALLLFFIGHYSNSTMFYHTHEVDGRTYCHSHFFGLKSDKGVPVASHTHTNSQLQLIDTFNTINLTDELDFPEIPVPTIQFSAPKPADLSRKPHLIPALHIRLRAPPAC